jgi:hypothetical protein
MIPNTCQQSGFDDGRHPWLRPPPCPVLAAEPPHRTVAVLIDRLSVGERDTCRRAPGRISGDAAYVVTIAYRFAAIVKVIIA